MIGSGNEQILPKPIVPVPARGWRDVRGQRVIIGQPGVGWRADLRADSRIAQGQRTYVPVLPEHDWYRAEAEQVEVFAPLIPIERVWVEAVGGSPTENDGGPEMRDARPVIDLVHVSGRRLVLRSSTARAEFERGFRAASAVEVGSDGGPHLLVLPELEWYRWTWTGRIPKATTVPAERAWVE